MGIHVYGFKDLEKTLIIKPTKFFDKTIRNNARQSLSILIRNTNVDEGNTHRGWQKPRKIRDSVYEVSNNIKTEDKKHFIVNILNKGRGRVYPKITNKLKLLYVPIGPTRIGRKKLGRPIPKNAKFGKHYIFCKSVKAFKGTYFIDKEIKYRKQKIKIDVLKRMNKL